MATNRTLTAVSLRWRLRGATMWPTFLAATIAEGITLDRLPFVGDGPDGFVPALLLAAGLNLVVVAVLAPAAGFLLRRRRRDLPRPIAADYSGTALLALLFAVLLVAGLVHHGAIARDDRDRARSYAATSMYVHNQARAYLPELPGMDAIKVEDGMWRTCVAGERPLCLFVDTSQSPPGITRDGDRIPNALWQR
jgi:hypothetical protein